MEMARSGDARLIAGARASLRTLARHQAANGQIPKFVSPAEDGGDFWYVGCIDATLWWLIAAQYLSSNVPDKAFDAELDAPLHRRTAVDVEVDPRDGLRAAQNALDVAG